MERRTASALSSSEPSATIVWGILKELGIADQVVLWNAFPWHPMKEIPRTRKGAPKKQRNRKESLIHSNRTPTRQELQAGLPLLELLLERFDQVPVIAVGRKAAESLDRLGIEADWEVRHPAMGGAPKFRAAMRRFLG